MKKYTSGELFGSATPSDIKDIFKEKKRCIDCKKKILISTRPEGKTPTFYRCYNCELKAWKKEKPLGRII